MDHRQSLYVIKYESNRSLNGISFFVRVSGRNAIQTFSVFYLLFSSNIKITKKFNLFVILTPVFRDLNNISVYYHYF